MMLTQIVANLAGWRGWGSGAALCLVTVNVSAQDSVRYPPLSELIQIGAPQVVIGEEERGSPALFGLIRGVAVDGQGDIYVLDASDHSIRRFAPSGVHVVNAGRSGRGPGDLAEAFWLWHDGEHTLFVVDWVNGINEFDTRGRELRFRRRFAEAGGLWAACKLRGALIGAGFKDGRTLHALSPNGEITRSFGEPFQADTDLAVLRQAHMGPMVVACDDAMGRLYVSSAAHGRVRAYDTTGQLVWDADLPGFLGARTLRDARGAVVTLFPKHLIETIRPVGRAYIVVQAHHKELRRRPGSVRGDRPRGVEEDFGVLTWVLSARDGRVLTRQYGGPFLMAGTDSAVVGYDDFPFPRVFVLQVSMPRR